MLALAIGVGSGCHSTDSGSEVITPNAGSGGMDAGTSLNLGDAQANALSAGEKTPHVATHQQAASTSLLDRHNLVLRTTEDQLHVRGSVFFDLCARLRTEHDFVRAVELPTFGARAGVVG